MKKIFLLFIAHLFIITVNSQTSNISSETIQNLNLKHEIKGLVLNLDNKYALPYANIYALHKNQGVITNENGSFVLDISDLETTDTLRFQYIGYKTRNITIGELDSNMIIYLKEDIINLSETLIFGSAPNAESIVKKVLKNKDLNYTRTTTSKDQTFIRERYVTDIEEMKFDMKKSSFEGLDDDFLKLVEQKIPKYSTSYTDFLGDLYFAKNQSDSVTIKIDPIRVVSLKEKEIDELEQMTSVFKNLLANQKENEYWKVKSGIFSQKVDITDESDSTTTDTVNENQRRLYYYQKKVMRQLNYSLLDDKDEWEFLHSTSKYKYTLAGGTNVNGEDVYIIDFSPKNSGNYFGRVYISTSTYALIRADYEFADDKTGRDFNLLGVGYTENKFSGSVYFEKKNGFYNLKYLSKKTGSTASFDRNISLLKKSERFLFDKKVNEIKIGLNVVVNNEESFELLILDKKEISNQQFSGFQQKEKMKIIYVDQFDANLWKGFAIIEPTEQMREYKKQEVIYGD